MLGTAFVLVLQLPPLAFGPARPVQALGAPRELTCAVGDLGRAQEPRMQSALPLPASAPGVDPRSLRPRPDRHFLHPAAEFALLMGAWASVHDSWRGTWDDRTWSTRTWQASGAVTPVLIPPQAPPMWDVGRR